MSLPEVKYYRCNEYGCKSYAIAFYTWKDIEMGICLSCKKRGKLKNFETCISYESNIKKKKRMLDRLKERLKLN